MTEADVFEWDVADPLAGARESFSLPDDVIYLDGNSLGAMPRAAASRVQEVVEREWGHDLIRSWNDNHWFELPYRIGDKIAGLIGADTGEVVVTDCVSINLYKLVSAALKLRPGRSKLVTEAGNFPTDLYILEGIQSSRAQPLEVNAVADRDQIISAIDEQTAVVLLTDVHYKTGHLLDMAAITTRAHDVGALVIWDLCHSAGALPVDLNAIGADFAVGCGYKYLNGGPGAPSFVFAAKRHLPDARQPLSGWWGHQSPFVFSDEFEPADGIGRMMSGTQGVIGLACAEVGVDISLRFGMTAIRDKSVRMTDLFIQLFDEHLAEYGFQLVSPRDSQHRGSQVAFTHAEGYAIMQALIARGVIGDFRAPDILRFGFAPLYLRYADVWQAIMTLAEIMKTGSWDCDEFKVVNAVT
ncbi:kynureninase [Luminiphilus syltensis NOR5-1B]|uniref:Kynureninase n=1 Tax=Luminiphilus syltensis NOR5-1B TaxID=565045 RepID=B8KU22_9GAMM|nr:kynureninase [Luminiphilus syltensis]EED36710.1 kynureninase [Luminiphilus syltensis NOR5-1B]